MKKDLYLAHCTMNAGESLKAQQLLARHNIFFVKEIYGCIHLKVGKKNLLKAKELLAG